MVEHTENAREKRRVRGVLWQFLFLSTQTAHRSIWQRFCPMLRLFHGTVQCFSGYTFFLYATRLLSLQPEILAKNGAIPQQLPSLRLGFLSLKTPCFYINVSKLTEKISKDLSKFTRCLGRVWGKICLKKVFASFFQSKKTSSNIIY